MTFLARTGSNSRVDACFLAIKQSLPRGCVQFSGGCSIAAVLLQIELT